MGSSYFSAMTTMWMEDMEVTAESLSIMYLVLRTLMDIYERVGKIDNVTLVPCSISLDVHPCKCKVWSWLDPDSFPYDLL